MVNSFYKRLALYILTVICWNCSCKEEFRVIGTIKGYPDTLLFVRYINPYNKAWMNDTIRVEHEKFTYQGQLESPELAYFIPYNFLGRYELFLENSDITFYATADKFSDIEVTGSKAHDEYKLLIKESRELRNDTERRRVSAKDRLEFLISRDNYSESLVLPYFASEWLINSTPEILESFLSGLNNNARKSIYTRYCTERLDGMLRTLPGKPAYDFLLHDLDGKEYRLSDFRGMHVLLEFSASWCGWCKAEIPYLRTIDSLTQGKPFRMFTINLDKERSLWEKEVEHEQLTWSVISDLKAFDSDVVKGYDIQGIPMIFLIDPEGNILSSGLRGEKLVNTVSNLFI